MISYKTSQTPTLSEEKEALEDLPPQSNRTALVKIQPLKSLALEMPDCALKDLLLTDKETLDIQEFLVKVPIYLRLLRRMLQT